MRKLSLLVVLALLGASSMAYGQDSASTEQARERFVAGVTLAREHRWADALAAFEASAALRPHALATYNIAYCERALGHKTRAWRTFTRALEEDGKTGALEPDLREAARSYAAELDAEIGTAIVTLNPSDAAITVDSRPLELLSSGGRPVLAAGTRPVGPPERVPAGTFAVRLDPGSHTILVESGGKTRTVGAEVASGALLKIDVSIAPPPPEPLRPPSPPLLEAPGLHGQEVAALVLGSMGLASLTVGAALGGVAAQRWSDAKGACPALTSCPDDSGHDLSLDAQQFANVATVGLVVGGLAAAGGLVLWLTTPSDAPNAASGARLRVGAKGVELAVPLW